jgi:methyl-accepting chemotaxis protein
MKNMRVSKKLILSFAIVIALAVAVGVVGIIGMNSLSLAQGELYDYNLLAIDAIGDLRELFANERNAMRTMILHQDDPDRVSSVLASFSNYDVIAAEAFAVYEKTITDPSKESAFFEARDTWLGAYAQLKRDCFALIQAGEFDEAYATYTTRGAAVIAPITDGLSESATINAEWATEADAAGDALYSMLTVVMIVIVIAAVAIAMFLAVYISGLISKPLILLSGFMHKAGSTGDLALSPADVDIIGKFAKVKDEIGQTIGNAASFVGHVTNISNELQTIANGDLTAEVKLLSNSDTMGKALKQMVDNLNNMFGNIQTSTTQVSVGSKQVADGAQSLAQGATEQAASIQQLSASIGEIATKTKDNAEIADRTAKLSDSIKNNALKGSQQMDDMITAVKEINDASQSISKIIKTIDDIAFQTNILALNAAVEAARAGQHGKGFAVVAEEVRNLASKSAEAAKDTGDMIQNSMEKAEYGSQIAGDTATSLKEIVEGISESSQLISDIASASEEQSLGISQINVGIDQVAQVVQQNSATAEESAAASEEMSSQSAILEELISQFKLKGSQSSFKGLPSSTYNPPAAPDQDDFADSDGFGKY